MELLLKDVIITDPASAISGKKAHIHIKNGHIERITTGKIPETGSKCRVIQRKNLYVSPSWVDLHANLCDPGHEHRENLESGRLAAMEGGFSAVAVLPETQPPIESKESVRYIAAGNKEHLVKLLPLGAVSKNLEGQQLTEMYDLHLAGAYAFTDGNRPVENSGILLRALQYSHSFGKKILITPGDKGLNENGQVHEGTIHLELGLKGQPSLAEALDIQRALSICEYTRTPMHFTKISAKESLNLIKEAKKKGLPVTAGVAVNNLFYDEDDLRTLNTNLKLQPPLRSKEDKKALRKAVLDGLIDIIVSDHYPVEDENKKCEFESAVFGATSLQTFFSMIKPLFEKDTLALINAIAINPRKLLGLEAVSIEEKQPASLTLFDPNEKWKLDASTNRSLSKNNPLWEKEITGRVVGLINNNRHFIQKNL